MIIARQYNTLKIGVNLDYHAFSVEIRTPGRSGRKSILKTPFVQVEALNIYC